MRCGRSWKVDKRLFFYKEKQLCQVWKPERDPPAQTQSCVIFAKSALNYPWGSVASPGLINKSSVSPRIPQPRLNHLPMATCSPQRRAPFLFVSENFSEKLDLHSCKLRDIQDKMSDTSRFVLQQRSVICLFSLLHISELS